MVIMSKDNRMAPTTGPRPLVALLAALLFFAVAEPAGAALVPGEYACTGSGGRILIGLGFRLLPDGSYTDLDGRNRGRVTYGADGSTVTFVGGHLDGQIGRGAGNGRTFRINAISCAHT
jgi:hypothetical protein